MNTHDLPPGIEVEIMRGDGVALESFTEYGRSVHFADGTQYWIRITNTTDTHAALKLFIDGRKANLSSILLYCNKSGTRKSRGRSVKGFDLTRDSVELENDEFETTSTYEPFVAKRPVSGASATTDHRIGTIKLEFFATRYATRQPGRTQQLTASNTTPSTQHNARRGVMATGSGAIKERRGKHTRVRKRAAEGPWLISHDPLIRRALRSLFVSVNMALTLGPTFPTTTRTWTRTTSPTISPSWRFDFTARVFFRITSSTALRIYDLTQARKGDSIRAFGFTAL